jgi:hypothetical protein
MSLKIYTTGNLCAKCNALKAAFQKAGIAYEEAALDASILAKCLCETGEWVQSAPLVLDGYVWHFSTDFFDSSGNLKADWLVELKGVRPRHEFAGAGGAPSDKEQKCKSIWG